MMWNVLIDRKGVNRIQTELLLRKAQSGDTGALAGFLWWISGVIPSLSVQNRKKQLH